MLVQDNRRYMQKNRGERKKSRRDEIQDTFEPYPSAYIVKICAPTLLLQSHSDNISNCRDDDNES